MKLNEITETGYYTCELDAERETIFEVIKNTDEIWLKEAPEQTLLIDEWTYKYTDEDGRKHYEIYGGNLVSVVNAEPFDVVKITDTKYTMDVSDPTIASKCNGTSMMEDKPTRLETAEQQLRAKEQECNQIKAERDKIKAIGDNYFDEFEMCCLDLPDAIDSLLKRYDNAFTRFKKERKELKAKNEELKKQVEVFVRQLEKANKEVITQKEKNAKQRQKNEKLEQTLAEIEPVLELYANSKIGEEQLDGTYKAIVERLSVLGAYTIHYDPKPAKQAMKALSDLASQVNKDRYKQTLIKVKEIVETAAKSLYTTKSDDYTDGYRWLGSIILQKIKECGVE